MTEVQENEAPALQPQAPPPAFAVGWCTEGEIQEKFCAGPFPTLDEALDYTVDGNVILELSSEPPKIVRTWNEQEKVWELPPPGSSDELPEMETTETFEILKVPLADTDYKEYGIKMGQANREIQQAEDELAAVKSQFKSRIDAAVAKRNEYAGIINAGCEYLKVDCHLIKDYRENTMTLVRLDTLEIVRTRTMTVDERQRGLGF